MNDPLGLFEHTQSKDPLDLFGEITPEESGKKQIDLAKRALANVNAGVEAIANTAAGGLSMLPGALAFGTNLLNTGVREGRLLTPKEGEEAFQRGADIVPTKYLHDTSSELGQEYTNKINRAINDLGIPLMGLGTTIPRAKNFLPKEIAGGGERFVRSGKNEVPTSEKLKALDELHKEKESIVPQQGDPLGLFPNLQKQSPMERMASDLGAPPPEAPVNPAMRSMVESLTSENTPATRAAQDAIEARQALMEQEMKKQATLSLNAAERARQENAPVLSPEAARVLAEQERARLQAEAAKTQGMHQMEIDDTPHAAPGDVIAPQYGDRMGTGRFDENGIPINADRSMEAQNVQNPLQRNLWGDELGQMHEQENPVSLSHSIDLIPDTPFKGDARDVAIGRLSGINRGHTQSGAINPAVFAEGFQKIKRLTDNLVLVARGHGEQMSISVEKDGKKVAGAVYEPTSKYDAPANTDAFSKATGTDKSVQRQGLQREVYKFASELGNDVVPSKTRTQAGEAMWKGFEKTGLAVTLPRGERLIPRSQKGALEIGEISKAVNKMSEKINDSVKEVINFRYNQQDHASTIINKLIPETKQALSRLAEPDSLESSMKKAMQQSDIPELGTFSTNTKSGPGLTAATYENNAVLNSVAQHLNYAYQKTDLGIRQIVKPIEKFFSSMSGKEFREVHELMKDEMFKERASTSEQLRAAGYSEKQINSVTMLRDALDTALEKQNAAREAAGRKPISKMEAYMSSSWHGDWHTPLLDKEGKLVWYIRTASRGEGQKAIDYLRKEFGDSLNISDKTKPEFRSSGRNPNTPNDVVGAYTDMIEMLKDSPETTDAISQAMQKYIEQKGYVVAGQNKHFLAKQKIRGFEGDRPWLSEAENAQAGLTSQMNYLKSALRWADTQEAVANIKQLISDPSIVEHQPNAVAYAKTVLNHEIGATDALTKKLEEAIARGTGYSRSSLYHSTADIKALAYLQTLGLSVGYMMATPLQAVMMVPTWHLKLSGEGFKHNLLKTSSLALSDTMSGLASHAVHEIAGKENTIPMTKLGAEALKYAEDSGVISKNIFDESRGLGEHAAVEGVKNILGWTIAAPEKVARLGAYMSFVHHLEASGKYTNRAELFRDAIQLTDNAITSFKSFDRPQVVNSLGVVGQAAYMYKSFVFNGFNQLHMGAKMAAKGNAGPLAAMLGMYAVMGGLNNIPFVHEADVAYNTIKDLMAEHYPELYAKSGLAKGIGIKGTLISLLPETSGLRDILGYGVPSKLLNTNLTTRLNLTVPTEGIGAVSQEMKEWTAIGKVAKEPTSKRAWEAAVYANVPPVIQGQMQAHLPEFHNASGTAVKPRNVTNPTDVIDRRRTPIDESRKALGVTSLDEYRDLETKGINKMEDKRIQTALAELSTRMAAGIADRNKEKIANNAVAYLQLNPDTRALEASINTAIAKMNLTPHEAKLMKIGTIQTINSELRLRRMNK